METQPKPDRKSRGKLYRETKENYGWEKSWRQSTSEELKTFINSKKREREEKKEVKRESKRKTTHPFEISYVQDKTDDKQVEQFIKQST